MLVVAVMATTQTFGLALGWGATRRDFSVGSGLVWIGLSAVYAAGMTLLGLLEDVTGNWGLGGSFFAGVYFGDGPWWSRFPIIACFLLFFFALGSATAAAYVRWRQNGMYVFFSLLALFLVGSAVVLTLTGGWPAFGGRSSPSASAASRRGPRAHPRRLGAGVAHPAAGDAAHLTCPPSFPHPPPPPIPEPQLSPNPTNVRKSGDICRLGTYQRRREERRRGEGEERRGEERSGRHRRAAYRSAAAATRFVCSTEAL